MNEASEKATADRGAEHKNKIAEKYFEQLHSAEKLTRIPVKHLYFAEYMDFQGGGESQISNRACIRVDPRDPKTMHRTWTCDFIPAWQVFELSFVPAPDTMPITELIPAVHVRRWKRW